MMVDYREYLGPDWKPSYENASTLICNHSVFMDPLVMMYRGTSSHVSKASILDVPFAGVVGIASQHLWINRSDKGARKDMLT